ncbi:Tetratricopeptide repeat-containing protein [Pedobacter steynii]|uniref:Tetratricopeptide repeat-containing protein n=1 Tax=Pedobacter steynii TaxID=430522 RepID=A0A1G9J2N3_9SPHI|nr:tetratricopeptide repeat protein [Pedobacter steynii]NQX38123.1 tetratricopeptide repeat protein [Pedobacter steynii]SDL31719.1 Tetratricopeptide repeat-containing protein [Pedobacter steynii]
MKRTHFYLSCLLCLNVSGLSAQTINPDSAGQALKDLSALKIKVLKEFSSSRKPVEGIQRMLQLGMWKEATRAIAAHQKPSANYKLLSADYLILSNELKKAEVLVNEVHKAQPKNEKAILLKAFLEIQAWRLPQAASLCEQALKSQPSEKLWLMLGRTRLLQKNYKEAMEIAKKVMADHPKSAGAYLLEADVYFWDQQPDLAVAPLKKSLEIDPYNADARFSYGYAIWRRVDARQLNAMAAQWELALAINPLHFQTHWHWGNGHTNLTYADYAEKDDDIVRKALEKADDQVRQNQVKEAIETTRMVGKQYPGSVLPLMHRASIYYIAFDMDRKVRLDSAESIFRRILAMKKHYGPAHNGLSAVIKSKRIPYLSVYDSISNQLSATKITDMTNFQKVFPDVNYYPGETVKAMAWNQLFTAVVYFPFLSKQENAFRIPPLHNDLAITMNSPSFRYMTTFDNRQWMDIRGVGSGAAAIEYVERGAFLERNVILHEYVHLFHGRVLTDAENRKIRSLYYQAMKEKRTLDYYSQNNESEYFAQTYPAYFEPVKVHPLDFKSMNTTSDLKSKDPEMYRFLDGLVKKERAYLAGDKQAMASNWSEVYLNLSTKVKQRNPALAAAYIDTALVYDQKYLPAYLDYAQLRIEQKDFKDAEGWIKKAEQINPEYAPVYSAYADLIAAKFAANEIAQKTAVQEQAMYLKKSFRLEDDYQELARVNMQLREMYKRNGMISEAIATAQEYGKNGATVSTYLRDRRDDALAYAAVLQSGLGYKEPVMVLRELVEQKPQNFEYRNLYADALAVNKQYDVAIQTLKEAQRILAASGNARADYNLRISAFYAAQGNKPAAEEYLQPFLTGKTPVRDGDKLRYVTLLVLTGHQQEGEAVFKEISAKGEPFYMAGYFYTKGKLNAAGGQQAEAITAYEQAVSLNPYLFLAYAELIPAYVTGGQQAKADALKTKLSGLEIKPGPAFETPN